MKSLLALFCGLLLAGGCSPSMVQIPSPVVTPAPSTPAPSTPAPSTLAPSTLAPSTLAPSTLLHSPQGLHTVELAPQAIPSWREHRQQRPSLLLLSVDPMLTPIPELLRDKVTTLVEQGDENAFRIQAKRQIADPVLLQDQTVSAAVQGEFFSELVWVIPRQDETQEIPLETLRQQLVAAGVATTDEAESLTQSDNVVTGRVRNLPFRCTTLRYLPKLEGPVVLHLDLNYFATRYSNEVTTPLFSLMHETLTALRQAGIMVVASTLAVSTEEGDVPLELRFLRDILTSVFDRPTLLDEPLPSTWDLRKDALYLENFFQPQAALERYQRLCELEPEAAPAEFDVYRTLTSLKDDEEAQKHLARAVQKDAGYAREYVNLALSPSKLPSERLSHLQKAMDHFPANPFIKLEKLGLLDDLGERQLDNELLDSLTSAHWSLVYYPEIPAMLKERKKFLDSSPAKR